MNSKGVEAVVLLESWCLPIPQEPAGEIVFRACGLRVQMESGGRVWQSRTCVGTSLQVGQLFAAAF